MPIGRLNPVRRSDSHKITLEHRTFLTFSVQVASPNASIDWVRSDVCHVASVCASLELLASDTTSVNCGPAEKDFITRTLTLNAATNVVAGDKVAILIIGAKKRTQRAMCLTGRTRRTTGATGSRVDSALSEAFNAHDLNALMSLFTEDLEFYHDAGGVQSYTGEGRIRRSLFQERRNTSRGGGGNA